MWNEIMNNNEIIIMKIKKIMKIILMNMWNNKWK